MDEAMVTRAEHASVLEKYERLVTAHAVAIQELDILRAYVAEAKQAEKTSAIDAAVADGRVTPAMRASIETFAAASDIGVLRGFLAGLPQQTRPTPIGSSVAPEGVASDEDAAMAKRLGISVETIVKYGQGRKA